MYKAISIDYKDLEPYLSSETVDIHYNKHYKGYLNKLNSILDYLKFDYRYSVVELISHIDEFPIAYRDSILYNAGGVLNHELYFRILGFNGNMSGELYNKVVEDYGSFDNFKDEFKKQANLMVGSGYTFLVLDNNNKLLIMNMPNQDTPYSYKYKPIMNIDLWEHAYYLDYRNDRAKYIDDFFSMVDFNKVNEEYKKAVKKI